MQTRNPALLPMTEYPILDPSARAAQMWYKMMLYKSILAETLQFWSLQWVAGPRAAGDDGLHQLARTCVALKECPALWLCSE